MPNSNATIDQISDDRKDVETFGSGCTMIKKLRRCSRLADLTVLLQSQNELDAYEVNQDNSYVFIILQSEQIKMKLVKKLLIILVKFETAWT